MTNTAASAGTDQEAADVWILDRFDTTDEAAALCDELSRRGCLAEVVDWDSLTPSCIPPGALREDGRFELPRLAVVRSRVITRNPPGHLAGLHSRLGLLEDAGVRLVNTAASLTAYENKIRQISALASAGLPVPPTRAVRTVEDVSACVAEWHDTVVKPPYGHASIDVVRLRSGGHGSKTPGGLGARESILIWHLLERHTVLCTQKFVVNPGRDLRVLVIGSRVVACYFHVSTAPDGSTRHPLYPYQWAKATLLPDVEEMAVRAAAVLGFDVASLDLVEGPDGHVIIEVNPNISRWMPVERTKHDRTPTGITQAFSDLLCDLLEAK